MRNVTSLCRRRRGAAARPQALGALCAAPPAALHAPLGALRGGRAAAAQPLGVEEQPRRHARARLAGGPGARGQVRGRVVGEWEATPGMAPSTARDAGWRCVWACARVASCACRMDELERALDVPSHDVAGFVTKVRGRLCSRRGSAVAAQPLRHGARCGAGAACARSSRTASSWRSCSTRWTSARTTCERHGGAGLPSSPTTTSFCA